MAVIICQGDGCSAKWHATDENWGAIVDEYLAHALDQHEQLDFLKHCVSRLVWDQLNMRRIHKKKNEAKNKTKIKSKK